jgi:hypothetical protein
VCDARSQAKHAGAYYKPVPADERTRVVHPYGIGSGGDMQLSGPIVDGFRIHQQYHAQATLEREGKGFSMTSSMTVPMTGALPDGPLPAGWVPGGYPTRNIN